MNSKQKNNSVKPELNTRKRKHVFKLVDGEYTVAQANNILFDLINSKINFHNTEIFKNKEKFGEDSPHSEKRVGELRAVMETLSQVLETADSKDKMLRIKSSFEIELIKK